MAWSWKRERVCYCSTRAEAETGSNQAEGMKGEGMVGKLYLTVVVVVL